jgi:hypothetical protein
MTTSALSLNIENLTINNICDDILFRSSSVPLSRSPYFRHPSRDVTERRMHGSMTFFDLEPFKKDSCHHALPTRGLFLLQARPQSSVAIARETPSTLKKVKKVLPVIVVVTLVMRLELALVVVT